MYRVSIDEENGLSPIRCQANILANAGLLLIGNLETNLSEFLIKIQNFHSQKRIWKYHLRDGGHFVQGGNQLTHKRGVMGMISSWQLQNKSIRLNHVCNQFHFYDLKADANAF